MEAVLYFGGQNVDLALQGEGTLSGMMSCSDRDTEVKTPQTSRRGNICDELNAVWVKAVLYKCQQVS